MNLQYSDCAEAVPAMCADVERRPSASVSVLSVGQKRFSIDANQSLERKPHTRVDDESEIEKKYSLGEVLGQGSFGVVREVTNRLTGQKFAMKIVNKEKVSKRETPCLPLLLSTHFHLWAIYKFVQLARRSCWAS